jgi:hypothetical protein
MMELNNVELHALACEIADVDGLDYDQALERAHQELGDVQHYAVEWDKCASMPSAAYLDVLTTLERGEQPTAAQTAALLAQDHVVAYILQHR